MHAEPYSIGQVTSYRWAGPGSSIATLGMSDLEKLPAPLPLWRLGMDRRLSSADRGEVIAIDLWTLDLMRRQTHGGGVHKKRKTPCGQLGNRRQVGSKEGDASPFEGGFCTFTLFVARYQNIRLRTPQKPRPLPAPHNHKSSVFLR